MTLAVPLNATGTSFQVLPAFRHRTFLLLRNYSTSGVTIWVAFGVVATAGNNGELEIPPGIDYTFGGERRYPQYFTQFNNNCPTESINVISGGFNTPGGNAQGCAIVMS